MDQACLYWVATLGPVVIGFLAVVVAFGAAWFYYGQLQAMRKARELDSVLTILRYVDDIELRRARWFVIEHGEVIEPLISGPFSWENWHRVNAHMKELSGGTVEIHKVDLWINSLNNISFLVAKGYVPYKVVVDEFMKNALLGCWEHMEPYIRHRQENKILTRAEPSLYARHLQAMVERIKIEGAR